MDVQPGRASFASACCLNNLTQMGVGLFSCANDNSDRMRPKLARLHDVLSNGMPEPGWEDLLTVPNYLPLRVVAQGLDELVMVKLHRAETACINSFECLRRCSA